MESEHDDDMFVHWFKNCGGFETLKSFNAKSYQELSEVHQYFFKTLLHYKIIDKRQIFVHAGLNFKNENIFEDKFIETNLCKFRKEVGKFERLLFLQLIKSLLMATAPTHLRAGAVHLSYYLLS
jgi:hypothetical protein